MLFEHIKKYLSEPGNVIFALDKSLPLTLYTDASQVTGPGFAGILFNVPLGDQKLQPVCMSSTFIPPSKANLNSTTLELAAIAYSLVKFHHFTAGAPFITVYCDSASSVKILKKRHIPDLRSLPY